MTICCNVDCAKTIALNMLALDSYESVSEERTCDAIGEVANMLMGCLKARLQDEFGNVEVSIPFVVSGRELENKLCDGAVRHLTRINIQDEYVAELSLLYKKAN